MPLRTSTFINPWSAVFTPDAAAIGNEGACCFAPASCDGAVLCCVDPALAINLTGIQTRAAKANAKEIMFPETLRGERSLFMNLQSILFGFGHRIIQVMVRRRRKLFERWRIMQGINCLAAKASKKRKSLNGIRPG